MGYEKDDAIYALGVSNNNLEYACTYLLSNPNPSQASQRPGLRFTMGRGPNTTSEATGNRT